MQGAVSVRVVLSVRVLLLEVRADEDRGFALFFTRSAAAKILKMRRPARRGVGGAVCFWRTGKYEGLWA